MINQVELYYFSPTGGTKKAANIFCEGMAENVKLIDLGVKEETRQPEGDVVVIAAPVFGGRIPGVVSEKISKIDGKGKKVVTLVVFGNRAYEDALLELNDVSEKCGFQVIASAALIAQHSMAPEVGKGRPDAKDEEVILDFAKKVLDKIENGSGDKVEVPGNRPYKDEMNMPAAPISLDACNHCGVCASYCPVDAIKIDGDNVSTDIGKCILCMACVAQCPAHARILPPPLEEKMEQLLGPLKGVRNENEFFI